jgi:ATP-dependent exoDNAse (exonuclease V) alpha subunit
VNGKQLLKTKSKFLCITGAAGSGKTFLARDAINLNPSWGVLCATTGAAARVLSTNVVTDVKTVHSTLGFYDVESLRNSRDAGTLHKNLQKIKKQVKRLVIDECSMLDAEAFEIIVAACEQVGLGIVLIGDFFQLPAVTPRPRPYGWTQWLFQTPSWKKFEVIRLDTQYRQSDENFLKGLNLLRAGKGEEAISHLKKAGVTFVPGGAANPLTLDFEGTTIVGTNNLRDQINSAAYAALGTDEFTHTTSRTGYWTERDWREWGDIPDSTELKLGTRVMVLRNLYGDVVIDPLKQVDTDAQDIQTVLWNPDGSIGTVSKEKIGNGLLQANGDTGVVEFIGSHDGGAVLEFIDVRRDDGSLIRVEPLKADNGKYHFEIDDDGKRKKIVDEEPTAWVTYLPVTKAWAVTVHKSQGLTLEHPTRIVLENFFNHPAMVYVAASRVKHPKHLSIVGGDLPVNGSPWLRWLCKCDPAVASIEATEAFAEAA